MQLVFVSGNSSVLVQFRYLNTHVGKEEPVVTLRKFAVLVSCWLLREIWQCLTDVTMSLQLLFQ